MPRPHAEYDDDRPSPKGSNTTLWIVLGVIGVVILLGLVTCAGVFYLGYTGVKAAKTVVDQMASANTSVENYLTKLQRGDTAAAYQLMSQGYKAKTTQAEFEQFLNQNSGLLNHTARSSSSMTLNTSTGTAKYVTKYTITGPKAGAFCTITLIEENGTWVVESITVP